MLKMMTLGMMMVTKTRESSNYLLRIAWMEITKFEKMEIGNTLYNREATSTIIFFPGHSYLTIARYIPVLYYNMLNREILFIIDSKHFSRCDHIHNTHPHQPGPELSK